MRHVKTPGDAVSATSLLPETGNATSPTIGQPGAEVAGSRVSIPPRVAVGEMLHGQAPAGSDIEAFGKRTQVDSNGRFQLQAPVFPGTYPIRIYRPSRKTPLLLHVEVTPAGT